MASRQAGRIAYSQLERLGLAPSTIHGWESDGHLERVHPRVYAVGHTAPSREAGLWAAVLFAGPGAMLSHGTAAHWLVHDQPTEVCADVLAALTRLMAPQRLQAG